MCVFMLDLCLCGIIFCMSTRNILPLHKKWIHVARKYLLTIRWCSMEYVIKILCCSLEPVHLLESLMPYKCSTYGVVLPSTFIWHFYFELLRLHIFWNIMKNYNGIQWLHKGRTCQQDQLGEIWLKLEKLD